MEVFFCAEIDEMNNSTEEETGSKAIIALVAKRIVAQLQDQAHAPSAPPKPGRKIADDQNGRTSETKGGT